MKYSKLVDPSRLPSSTQIEAAIATVDAAFTTLFADETAAQRRQTVDLHIRKRMEKNDSKRK